MKSPFKFLDSYTKDDREIFFGREREIEELYHRVFESKIMLVYGVSGTGKSSLIHCGLANKFQDTDWLPLVIRRGGNIIESMSAAIKTASITAQQAHLVNPPDFKKSVRSLYLDYYKPVFFIFDQFEELFIFGDREERRAFIHIVKTLTESELQCRMIFVMREEYMAGVSEFEKFIPTFFSNRVRIEKMSHRNALEAIKGPCKVFNISLEEGFAESLLEKLSPGETDVELTYLQVFLDKIFRLAIGFLPPPGGESKGGSSPSPESKGWSSPSFTLALLQKTGNVSDLLGSFLDEQIALLHDPDSGLAVLKSFVSVIGTKRQMSPEEVCEYSRTLGQQITESGVQELLQTFIQLRILRDKDENGKYELRHDALATKIYEKISLVEKEILEIRQFIENAHNNYQRRGVLLSADDLDYIAPYESRLYLPDDLRILINNSHAELLKTKRRRRIVASASALMLLMMFAAFALWALVERNMSRKQEVIASANYFASLSKEFTGTDPTKALWLAEYATYLNPTEENRSNLVYIYSVNDFYEVLMPAMFKNLQTFYNFRILDNASKIAINKGNRIYVSDTFGNISETVTFNNSSSLLTFEVSASEKYLLTRFSDDTVRLLDFSGKLLCSVKSPHVGFYYPYQIPDILFLPDSKSFLTVSMSKEISVWSFDGSLLASSDIFVNDSYPIITPSSDKLFVCSYNGLFYRWNLKTNAISSIKLQLNDSLYVRNPPVMTSDERIALYRTDKKLCYYDTTGRCILSWQIDYAPNEIISASDKNLIVTYNESFLDLWDYNGKNVERIKCSSTISNVRYDPDSKRVLFSTQNRLMAFHIKNPEDNLVLKTKNRVFFNENQNCLFEYQRENKQIIRYSKNGNIQQTISLNGDSHDPRLSESGNYLAMTNTSKPFLTITDLRNGNLIKMDNVEFPPFFVTFSNNDKYIVTSGKLLTSPKLDGIIFSSPDNLLNLWAIDGRYIRSIAYGDDLRSVKFSPDDSFFLTSAGYNIFAKDTTGRNICAYTGHAGDISSYDISKDGRYLLTGAYDGTTRIWSVKGNILKIIQTHEMGNSVDVSFMNDNSSFMVYIHNRSEIQIYSFSGLLLQTIPILTYNNLPLNCYYSSSDSSIIYSDRERGGLFSKKLKSPVDTFIIPNNHNDLSISDKIMYGMVSVNDLLSSENYNDLYFAAIYLMYWKTRGVFDPDELKIILTDAEKLFKRGLEFDPDPERIHLKLTEIYLQRQKLLNENTKKDVEKSYRVLSNSDDRYEIIAAADFYLSSVDSSTLKLGFAEKALALYKKIPDSGNENLSQVAQSLSDLSWKLIEMKSFKAALDAALIALEADDTNPYIYTNLPLAYIFNGQYSSAEKIYMEWKDKPWGAEAGFSIYREAFLDDLNTLENEGITHPDFEKVKELLRK